MTPLWTKLGQIYDTSVTERHPKLLSHAANPLPVHLTGNVYRIFFSGRDATNRSSVGAVDIDIVLRTIVQEHSGPFFEYGPEGSFYAAGVSIGNCYATNGRTYMLFMGWQTPTGGHWRGDIGRLIVQPDVSLALDQSTPFMASDAEDPISLSYPWVLPRRQGGFDMWYGSTTTWDAGNGEMIHAIKHASSDDGHSWQRNGVAVPYNVGIAQAFSRPSVVYNPDGTLQMWFSYRSGLGEAYRIGHAISEDGHHWTLQLTPADISLSATGWDSEMMAYPYVFDHDGQRYMLYNGNAYGKCGFGLAAKDMD